MRTSIFSAIAAFGIAIISALGATPASAGAHAPLGYQLMCLQHPEQCQGGGASTIASSDKVLAVLKRVNSRVNSTMRAVSDGSVDVWNASASGSGDCEDFVLAKRKALIKAGLPANALRIAYVKTRSGEGHAILVVKTGGKDLVLDNLTGVIKPLSQTGYRIVSMQGANPLDWS